MAALGLSSNGICADCFQPLQSRKHLLPKIVAAGWLCEAAVAEVAERADHVLDLCQSLRVLVLYLSDVRLEAATGLLDAGVDSRERVGFLAAVA
jgi:hypothetical protein